MKLDRLLAYTRQPELLATDESQDLETLLQEYPYFSAAQLLLTIKYKKQNSSRLNRQLQRAAAHLPDKYVLATALNEDLAELQLLEQQALSVSEEMLPQPAAHEKLLEAAASTQYQPEITRETTVIATSTATKMLEPGAEANSVEVDVEESATVAEMKAEDRNEKEENKQENSSVKAESALTLASEIKVDVTADETEVSVLAEEEPISSVAKPSAAEIFQEQADPKVALIGEQQFLAQPHDRLSWFRFFAGKPLREQPDDVLEELYLEHMSGDFLQAESATLPELKNELKAVINHNAEVASDKNLEEVIRRLAYESISDEELPASETLAAIYESQKDYKKALRIYQKLMLKFPDRMTYFAGLIATTKEKLNN